MSAKSACSTLTDVPGVTSAVERLQELAFRMKGDEFGFADGDVNNIDKVIESIQELHIEVSKLHEKFETETIKASVLRHKLQFFPTEIKNELQDAINAARQSNANEMDNLQLSLDQINKNIETLTEQHRELEIENAVLHPERDQVRAEHEEIIAQLNQRMAQKASKQISLNETRDKLRDTNQKIVDLEEGILQLKEDLIQERAEARIEKKKLKKAVYDTTVKTKEQKEANLIKKRELDELHEKVDETEEKLDTIRKSIRRFETSRSRLEGQDRALTAQLNRENKRNAEMTERGIELKQKLKEQEAAWNEKRYELTQTLTDLEKQTSREGNKNEGLEIRKLELEDELREKREVQKIDEIKVKEHNDILQASKMDLAIKAEDVARLQSENIEMEQRITELSESHERKRSDTTAGAILATLQKQIEEAREVLGKERKDRMDLQERRDSVQKEIDDYKIETNRFLNEQNSRITEGKRQHDELTREGNALQKSLREGDEKMRQLKEQKDKANKEFESKQTQLEKELQTMKTEIGTMEHSLEDKKIQITERAPTFTKLEEEFETNTVDYERVKKEVVTLKNKKLGLEDAVRRAKKDIEKMEKPHTQLKADLKQRREESLKQLKTHAEQTKSVEHDIYGVGCKLKTALEENDKFMKAIAHLENEIANIEKNMGNNDGVRDGLQAHLDGLKGDLNAEWDKDNEMGESFGQRDQLLVDELGILLEKVTKRENVIGDITGKLGSELTVLSGFLDNVAKRRPKEARKSKSSRAAPTPRPTARETKAPKDPTKRDAIETVADANVMKTPTPVKGKQPHPPATPKSATSRSKTPVTFALPEQQPDTARSVVSAKGVNITVAVDAK